jgi:hypothetical protein
MKMEQTQCSETSALKLLKPGNNPEESITTFRTQRKFEIKNSRALLSISFGVVVKESSLHIPFPTERDTLFPYPSFIHISKSLISEPPFTSPEDRFR